MYAVSGIAGYTYMILKCPFPFQFDVQSNDKTENMAASFMILQRFLNKVEIGKKSSVA